MKNKTILWLDNSLRDELLILKVSCKVKELQDVIKLAIPLLIEKMEDKE